MRISSSITLLVSRIALGIILMGHGWQKFSEWGIAGTTDSFDAMGVPAASLAAVVAAVIEFVGGILIIAGLFTRWVSGLVVLQMIGAGVFANHFSSGLFIDGGGWELVGAIAAAALAFVAVGAGQISLDRIFFGKRAARG